MQARFRQDIHSANAPGRLFDDLLELVPQGDWCTPKEAAHAVGMDPDSFRKAYCDPRAPRLTIWQRPGPNGGRRILVCRASVRQLIQDGLLEPVS